MNIHAALPRIPKSRGKKNRPGDTGWKQQTLSAYRPLLTFRCALPIVVVLSVVLIAGGILLYESALSAQEGVIDYTKCLNFNGSQQPWSVDPNMPPHPYLPPIPPNPLKYELLDKDEGNLGNEEGNNTCIYNLHLNQSFTGNVTFYYGLTGYFQNLRQYFRSRNDQQLLGVHLGLVEDCYPFDRVHFSNGTVLPIVPCGAVANSLFNDTFELYYQNDTLVPWTSQGILADNIRERKFKNPVLKKNQKLCDAFNGTEKPPSWNQSICDLGDSDTGMGLENFDLIQWMTASALPDFRKTYRRLDRQANDTFKDGLPAGNYTLIIKFNYPVASYNSTKKFIIAVEGFLGPKNYFIAYVYLATGAFFASLAILMAIVEFCPHSPLNRFVLYCSERLKDD